MGGGDPVQKFGAHMGLGTKNRQKQTRTFANSSEARVHFLEKGLIGGVLCLTAQVP
jgi:hypothetical protein